VIRGTREEGNAVVVRASEKLAAEQQVLQLAEREDSRQERRMDSMNYTAERLIDEATAEKFKAEREAGLLTNELRESKDDHEKALSQLRDAQKAYQKSQKLMHEKSTRLQQLSDKWGNARAAASHAARNLVDAEHAFDMANSKKMEDDKLISQRIARAAQKAQRQSQHALQRAKQTANAKIAEEKMKANVETSALAEKVKHTQQVMDKAVEEQATKYQGEVDAHGKRMEQVENAAASQNAASEQLVEKVNKFKTAAEEEAKQDIEAAVRATREAEAEASKANNKAAAETAMANQVEKDAQTAQDDRTNAEVQKETAQRQLAVAQESATQTQAAMAAELQETLATLDIEKEKSVDARAGLKEEQDNLKVAQERHFAETSKLTNAQGTLATERLKEQTRVRLAESAVASTKEEAALRLERANSTAFHAVESAKARAAADMSLLKLQAQVRLEAAEHQATQNISNAQFKAAQEVAKSQEETRSAEARTLEATTAYERDAEALTVVQRQDDAAEARLAVLVNQSLPTLADLDPEGDDYKQPSMHDLMKYHLDDYPAVKNSHENSTNTTNSSAA